MRPRVAMRIRLGCMLGPIPRPNHWRIGIAVEVVQAFTPSSTCQPM